MRGTMVVGGVSEFGIAFDLALLAAMTVSLILLAGRLYPRVAR